ncbi:UNVERIFIED_CONTAM: hypothetical protein Sradi_3797700 [Sesamum radiatum]|uniref:Reverse transcriptase domain-containing protein n=1 Tax=Sesamum radiatum TaxID=300843 RepID=A0AAW2Q0F9_SESRA
MLCVCSVSFSFILNGSSFGYLRPGRGLRQGDPLSPYLFLFCAEAFSGLVRRAEVDGVLRGVRVSRNRPRVSHLLFADDTLIFCDATPEAILTIHDVLTKFEGGTGLQVNYQKSAIVFSRNVPAHVQEELAAILGVIRIAKHEKYLGLPSLVGRSKREIFGHIKERVWTRLQGWTSRRLSQAGRAVLIQSVILSIPAYIMSWFLIPKSFLSELESMAANFFWDQDCNRKIHWVGWKALCKGKKDGDFFTAPIGSNPSYTWRSIVAARPLLTYGIRWEVGDGEMIRVLGDPWLPRPLTFRIISKPKSPRPTATVSALLDEDRNWKEALIREEFDGTDAEFRSAYALISAQESLLTGSVSSGTVSGLDGCWDFIWKAKVQPKVRLFAWRCCKDALSFCSNLLARGIRLDGKCLGCYREEEGLDHILRHCSFARLIWAMSNLPWQIISREGLSVEDWMRHTHKHLGSGCFERFFILAWLMWINRNNRIFVGRVLDAKELVDQAGSCLRLLDMVCGGSREGRYQEIKYTKKQMQMLRMHFADKFGTTLDDASESEDNSVTLILYPDLANYV